MPWTVSASARVPRDPKFKALDASALYAIAQAAVNVELFTIPLYMGTLYSIQGTHQITAKGQSNFKGRLWPGGATTAIPANANETAFNIIFSVFIQEMLHLQLAANIATAIGASPSFTSPMLQDANNGWTCYGPTNTIIPHIIDLRDMDAPYNSLIVNIAALTKPQVNLFLAIEEPDAVARKHIVKGKYFPTVPFAGWETWYTEKNLPMFGTIGALYQCYYDYLHIRYSDGTSLWQYVTVSSRQRDLFNVEVADDHPAREYPGFEASLSSLKTIVDMMDAITDQGEGSTLIKTPANLAAVEDKYRSDDAALKADYPSYTDAGKPAPSADAAARFKNDGKDHFERFGEVMALLDQGKIVTWTDWFKAGNVWKKEDLQAPDYNPNDHSNLPTTAAIAAALNTLAAPAVRDANHKLISKVAAGAIAGVTTVLNEYWKSQNPSNPVAFPSPSMGGTGDRMAICWALFGQAPDLSLGVDPIVPGKLYHACQSLDFAVLGNNQCAAPEVFHTCIGSNKCKAQGGCGFVQQTTGGGICGHAAGTRGPLSAGCVHPPPAGALYSAPSDNKCGTFGGCAVPISASQVYPKSGTMQLFDFTGSGNTHGVSLSIGSTDPLDTVYLRKLRDLANYVRPVWISDHLCWTGINGVNSHDLLPMPLTRQSLAHVVDRVRAVQDFLGRPLVLENPSTYLEFRVSDIPEWEFLRLLAEQSGCGLLLDVNNVYVSATNHGFDMTTYVEAVPVDHIVQVHLAGCTDCGTHMIDTHNQPVPDRVWPLYVTVQQKTGGVSTLLEWDADIPPYAELIAQLAKAKDARRGILPDAAPPAAAAAAGRALSTPIDFYLGHGDG